MELYIKILADFYAKYGYLEQMAALCKENNVELINADHMKIINDKRAKEKAGK